MIREVTLSRDQAKTLLNELEDIEARDGKGGFSRTELKESRDLLTSEIRTVLGIDKKILLKNRQSITAKSLFGFLSQLRKAFRKLPKSKDACSLVDTPRFFLDNKGFFRPGIGFGVEFPFGFGVEFPWGAEVCDTMIYYSLRMIICERKNDFEVKMEQVSGKFQLQPLEEALEGLTLPPNPFPHDHYKIDPWPMPTFPYRSFNPQKEKNSRPMCSNPLFNPQLKSWSPLDLYSENFGPSLKIIF